MDALMWRKEGAKRHKRSQEERGINFFLNAIKKADACSMEGS